MIKSDAAYRKTKANLKRGKKDLEDLQKQFEKDGLSLEQIKSVVGVYLMNIKELEDAIKEYESKQ